MTPCLCHTDEFSEALRFCAEHHRFYVGMKELPSVTKVLRSCWPVKPDFSAAPPDVLENARQRGVELDGLLSVYVAGKLDAIPAGTREDVAALFFKAQPWLDAELPLRSQVMVTDGSIAGFADFVSDKTLTVIDLKTTYDIEPYYAIQVGAYLDLYEEQSGNEVVRAGILHVTARFAQPKWIPLNVDEIRRDWQILRRTWEMAHQWIDLKKGQAK